MEKVSHFKKLTVGLILTPYCNSTDLVEMHTFLGCHPRNKIHYIAEINDFVETKNNFKILPTNTFGNSPHIDILVIGGLDELQFENERLLNFLKESVEQASQIIAISNGVLLLAKLGLLNNEKVTADRHSIKQLISLGFNAISSETVVKSGKFYSAGPSTGTIEAALTVLKDVRGENITKFIEHNGEYDPHPQFSNYQPLNDTSQLMKGLKPLKVAVIFPPYTYAPDVIGAIDVLGNIPNTEFYYVWNKEGRSKGFFMSPTSYIDTSFEKEIQYDVILVGALVPSVSADKELGSFLQRYKNTNTTFISICQGTLVYAGAGLLEGVKATTNYQLSKLLSYGGVIPGCEEVEVDGQYYSSGPVAGSFAAAIKYINDKYGADLAQHIEQDILEYTPNPVMGVGSPHLASKGLKRLTKILAYPLNIGYKKNLIKGFNRYKRSHF